ncbi:hypothetical protein K491DRAFT_465502 [Lophiostoma macrostomum CBS 122681]|uniref:Uncharacterized protein n=1 Tax=Lophiostoma macrostomum CBS 122681 TaxID=1314788 RepID=A0A6A6T5R5_9PLEO|nr:hypothetical protein K491DRAFT_465502 [Lophiostoma macrostomum CBS 122681]
MEGVAAFSLACNIMQTVQFSLSAAKLCKDLYRGSSPDKDVESYCARLRKAVNSLKQTGLTTTPSDQQHEQQLQKVAKDVISAADNIQKELDKLRTDSQRSRWRALKSTATYMMGTKRKIDRLNTSLEKGKDSKTLLIQSRARSSPASELRMKQPETKTTPTTQTLQKLCPTASATLKHMLNLL